jgi:hypothetical protein
LRFGRFAQNGETADERAADAASGDGSSFAARTKSGEQFLRALHALAHLHAVRTVNRAGAAIGAADVAHRRSAARRCSTSICWWP